MAYKFFDKKLRVTSTSAGTDKTSGGAIKGSEKTHGYKTTI